MCHLFLLNVILNLHPNLYFWSSLQLLLKQQVLWRALWSLSWVLAYHLGSLVHVLMFNRCLFLSAAALTASSVMLCGTRIETALLEGAVCIDKLVCHDAISHLYSFKNSKSTRKFSVEKSIWQATVEMSSMPGCI